MTTILVSTFDNPSLSVLQYDYIQVDHADKRIVVFNTESYGHWACDITIYEDDEELADGMQTGVRDYRAPWGIGAALIAASIKRGFLEVEVTP